MIRAMLIAFGVAVLICAFIDRPKPVISVETQYCVITYRVAAKDQLGGVHIIWTKGWGLCSELDRYEEI